MTQTVELPLWLFILIVLFALVTFASNFLFPSVRWFFRRRLERAVARLNTRLTRPIEPFKLAERQDMIQRLIYDPEVTQAIVDHARRQNVREDVAFETARRYAREIVPSFSAFAYFGLGIRIARFLANTLYDVRTGPRNTEIIASIPKGATVVFIMNHRSNMDYVLVTYLAARASALSYAVGEWARIWPLSRLIKSMGAYFIRRKSRGRLYRRVLARYVHMATQGGVTQAIFPEGGLSLDGKLAPPKLGLLAYVAEAGRLADTDVVFVPVAINYDRVLEDRVLIRAHEMGSRRFGAKISVVMRFVLEMLWLRLRGRFHRFGLAAVNFGEPVALSSFDAETPVDCLADQLMQQIEHVMPQMPVPALAQIMLEQVRIPEETLLQRLTETVSARAEKFLLSDGEDARAIAQRALAQTLERHLIVRDGVDLVVAEEQRSVLAFYANALTGDDTKVSAAAQ